MRNIFTKINEFKTNILEFENYKNIIYNNLKDKSLKNDKLFYENMFDAFKNDIKPINFVNNYNIFEAVQATDEEYYETISLFYDDNILDLVKEGEMMAKYMTRNPLKTLKTDNGNLIVRWGEGNNNFIILGAVTKTGKLNRYDIIELKDWIELVIEKIENYYTIYTSPNELSEPLVKRIISLCEKRNIDIGINIMTPPSNIVDSKTDIRWNKTYIIKKK